VRASASTWSDELEPALLAYVEESRQAERRRIEEREENARRLAERRMKMADEIDGENGMVASAICRRSARKAP